MIEDVHELSPGAFEKKATESNCESVARSSLDMAKSKARVKKAEEDLKKTCKEFLKRYEAKKKAAASQPDTLSAGRTMVTGHHGWR